MIDVRNVAKLVAETLDDRWPNLNIEGFDLEEATYLIEQIIAGKQISDVAICTECGCSLFNGRSWIRVGGFHNNSYYCEECW